MNAPANLQQHPLSAAFPRPTAAEAQALEDSIEVIGVQIPITVYEGMVADGWSRYTTAVKLGMDCPMVELDADTDPRDFAKSQAARRNLTPSQTAMVITEIYKWKPAHRPVKSTLKVELSESVKKDELSSPLSKSNAELADIAGATVRTIQQAKAVQTHAVPEVVAAVKAGAIGLPKAAAIARMPKAEQAAAVAKPLPKPAPKDYPVNPHADQDKEAIAALVEENARLNDCLAVAAMDATDEERAAALTTLAELRAEVKKLQATNRQLTHTRDSLMNELAAAKRLCISLQSKLRKAT